jgi:uncharacterized protein
MRNWFLDYQEIDDLLFELTDADYDKIYERRHIYPANVRYVLDPHDFDAPRIRPKLQLKEISEAELLYMEKKEEQDKIKKMEKAWEDYLVENNVDRPLTGCDTELDTIYQKILIKKTELNKYLETRKVKYVPVHLRKTTQAPDPKQVEYEDALDKLDKEFNECELLVKQEDERWLEEHKQQWIKKNTMF